MQPHLTREWIELERPEPQPSRAQAGAAVRRSSAATRALSSGYENGLTR